MVRGTTETGEGYHGKSGDRKIFGSEEQPKATEERKGEMAVNAAIKTPYMQKKKELWYWGVLQITALLEGFARKGVYGKLQHPTIRPQDITVNSGPKTVSYPPRSGKR